MDMDILLFFGVILFVPAVMILVDFLSLLFAGKRVVPKGLMICIEIVSFVILPLLYASFGKENNCCADETGTAAFAPQHQLSIFIIYLLAVTSYSYSRLRDQMAAPVIEVLINISLLLGVALGFLMCFHATEVVFVVFGSLPVVILGITMLIENHMLFIASTAEEQKAPSSRLEAIAWKLLTATPILKFPLLLLCCLPVLVLLMVILLLFGQKPDSMIRAFTETYKHGFSQWDHKCDNVHCGGHYLCSVAAQGHQQIVKPQRMGIRHHQPIICNRQLLVSNAFEDLIQERMPRLHGAIRKQYNKVGNVIHRYYYVFHIRIVADIIYLLMKPLEWCFLLILYTFDRKPENRIAKQYISTSDRQRIDKALKPA